MKIKYKKITLAIASSLLLSFNPAFASLHQLDIIELKSAYKNKTITNKNVIKVFVDRTEILDNQNSIINLNHELLKAPQFPEKQASLTPSSQPLAGIPFVIKDNIHVKGLPNTAGSPALKDFIPTKDAPVIQKLKAAGAIILAKTNMHELAYGITSNNAYFGAVKNAYDEKRSAGGSSGGTGAAIASCLAPAGLGTDTGGSARIPASVNGIVGLRPTATRYPSGGTTPISITRDTVGPMARTVADVALIDSVITEESIPKPTSLKSMRLGVPKQLWDNLDPAVEKIMQSAIDKLERQGVELVDVDMEAILSLNHKLSFPIVLYETRRDLTAYLEEYYPKMDLISLTKNLASLDVKGLFESAIIGKEQIPESVYMNARHTLRPQLQGEYAALFSQNRLDALVFPTIPALPAPISGVDHETTLNGKKVPTFPTYIRNTDAGSNAGLPGISLPAGLTDSGLPIGLALDGPAWSDRQVLSLGLSIEKVLGKLPLSALCH